MPLEVWLQTHTFPLEARYADLAFAERAYSALIADLLALGTTTALFFATIHQEATRLLADICLAKGMRALIGKVAMDDPASCPDYYRDAFRRVPRSMAPRRSSSMCAGTPQTAMGSCSPPSRRASSRAAQTRCSKAWASSRKAHGCHIQTHCSESDWEHGAVLARYGRSDAESLDGFGLMTRRTVLAHSNLVSDGDMDLIRARGAGIAHCPLSNAYFSNAVFPLRRAIEKGLHVGLGTDISGGPSASLLDNCRMAIAASRMLEDGVDARLPPEERGRPDSRIDWKTAFHLATAGGAKALDLPIGRFEPGCYFDAIAVDAEAAEGTIRLFDDDLETVLQKIIYTASRANIADVWVAGRRVAGAAQ